MNEVEIFKCLPWHPGDPKTVLVKVAWFERAGGARETPMLKPFARKLARKGLIARMRTEHGRIALRLTPAGHNLLISVLLETVVGHRPADCFAGPALRWTEARYIQRLLAAADEHDEDQTGGHAHPIRTTAGEYCA